MRAKNGILKDFFGTRHSLLCEFVYLFRPTSVSVLWRTCVRIHIFDCIEIVCKLPLLPNNIALKHFTQIGSGAKCWLVIYRWDAGLPVNGRICDSGQTFYICGNKMPTRCNRGFYCRSYCLLNMFRASLCPSSGAQEYYTVAAACGIFCCGFSSSWSGVELRVMRPVCRMLLQ